MNKRLKVLTSAFFIALALFAGSGSVRASEGTAEIKSTIENGPNCYTASVLMENFEYKVTLSCRNVIYPPSEDQFAYMLWAVPIEGGRTIKLGALGVGKGIYKTKDAFSELFVTSEGNDKVRSPSANVVARGLVDQIEILKKGIPTDEAETTEPAESFGEIIKQPTPIPTLIPTDGGGGFLSGVKRTGIFFAVGIFVLLLFIAFLTRSRS